MARVTLCVGRDSRAGGDGANGATMAGEKTHLSKAGGGSMGATAAREAAREMIMREAASGRGQRGI